jgi:cyclohexanone monooxygenase
MAAQAQEFSSPDHLDVLIVGAGFAGIYMLYRARSLGLNARIIEAAGGAGGTWYWNRYPGARCDIESMQYSYQFDDDLQQSWDWSEKYASQAEILDYAQHVIERYDLAGSIQYNTRALSVHFDEQAARWSIGTSTGESISAQFCVMATGCLSSANLPDFPNKDKFAGPVYHTGQWPHEGVDFTGLKVAVIGTGSSAIQAIPEIASQAGHLTIFQRTPAFTVPAHNRPLTDEERASVKADYSNLRQRAKSQILALDIDFNTAAAADLSEEEILAECERRWERGALNW